MDSATRRETPQALGSTSGTTSDPDFSRFSCRKSLWKSASSHKTQDAFRQPETRPISQDQLAAEIKGIYIGLVMVEAKCIEIDNRVEEGQALLNEKQWQVLIVLHRALLHEHYDFFRASQHRSASSALRRLATKYAMPARMWRHGMHSFLELVRHKLAGRSPTRAAAHIQVAQPPQSEMHTEWRIRGSSGELRIDALADTGASINAISLLEMKRLGLTFETNTTAAKKSPPS